jgi:HNH endonuclease
MPNRLHKSRSSAYEKQQGYCCYCNARMWINNLESFAREHGLTEKQARLFKCTAEHLLAKQDGGGDAIENIAAACWFCNSRRHYSKKPRSPEGFKTYVDQRMKAGRWHRWNKLSS